MANRHRRMLDYLTGTCAWFGWQGVVGHALAAIEDGVNNSTDGWLQLISSTRQAFIDNYWTPNNASGLTPSASEIGQWDVLNAAAGLWYFNSLDSASFGKSYQAVQWKATQYNFGPTNVPSGCQPSSPSYAPSAYAWTLSFLAWGDDYASVSDASYGHATSPQRYARRVTDTGSQNKYLNPSCSGATQLTKPGFVPSYTLLTSPHGRRSTNKQFVILARHAISYISSLAVALHIKRTFTDSVAPVVTADTYFAVDCMKHQSGNQNGNRDVCVIVLGSSAKQDVQNVYPGATAYSSFSAWSNGSADGYINAADGSTNNANFVKARDEGVAAYNAGY